MKALIGMLSLLLVTVYVWYQITMIQTGYEIQQLQQEQRELHRLHQALLIEAASRPRRIESSGLQRHSLDSKSLKPAR